MTSSRRRFVMPVPDWGQDHLSSEAIAAYVDDELAHGPYMRAAGHIAACRECATQVAVHRQTRSALRSAQAPCLPTSLMSALRSIPQEAELPAAPAGLAMGPDGQLVDVLRPEAFDREVPEQRSHRRMKLGATAAVSGLALGALAFGVSGLASSSAPVQNSAERGVFNGSVVGGGAPTEASLRLPDTTDRARFRLDRSVRSFLLGP